MTPGLLEIALRERLEELETLKNAFRELFPQSPKRLPRGQAQNFLLNSLGWDRSGLNKRLVSEALLELGYDKVKIEGTRFYRRRV